MYDTYLLICHVSVNTGHFYRMSWISWISFLEYPTENKVSLKETSLENGLPFQVCNVVEDLNSMSLEKWSFTWRASLRGGSVRFVVVMERWGGTQNISGKHSWIIKLGAAADWEAGITATPGNGGATWGAYPDKWGWRDVKEASVSAICCCRKGSSSLSR